MALIKLNKINDDIIKLNVGGKKGIEVYRSLLTSVSGSMLEAMFSGWHSMKIVKDGAIFIDRDPQIFKLVLNYLWNN